MFLRHENWTRKKRKSRKRRTSKKSHKEMSKRIREEEEEKKKIKLVIEEKTIKQGRVGFFTVNNNGIIYELEIVEFSELSIRYIYKGKEYNFSEINLKEFRKVIRMNNKITPKYQL